MKKIAVVLAGNGFKDGTEVTEAVSTLIILSELRAEVTAFAPDLQFQATDHITGRADENERSLLAEAARITRGQIQPLGELEESDFDGVVFPGGVGAALHLCSWAKEGSGCTVEISTEKIIRSFHSASKPIAAMCIAPALVSRVLGEHGVTVTIGNDAGTAAEIEKTGAQHENCPVDDYITDRMNKVISTPAYMYGDAKAHLVFKGIEGALREFYEMA
jgi:enhancing lycopene biosynthesis protein 2